MPGSPAAPSGALSASVIAGIQDLELAARLVVEGLRAGGHRSPFHGYSAEFQQHRSYRAGDDLKYVDWKLLARTDRLYTKQFRETTSMSVVLVLDASASMDFPREPAAAASKFRYAQVVAASLAYMVSTQGDAVGLVTASGDGVGYFPPRGGPHHLRSLIARLDRIEARGSWQPAGAISLAAERLRRRGVLIVLSDFYDAEEATRRELRRVGRIGHDAAMLQVLSPQEREFPFDGELLMEDLESGTRRQVNALGAVASYRAAMAAFLDRCRTEARRDGVDYALLGTDTPPDRALRSYLLARAAFRS